MHIYQQTKIQSRDMQITLQNRFKMIAFLYAGFPFASFYNCAVFFCILSLFDQTNCHIS